MKTQTVRAATLAILLLAIGPFAAKAATYTSATSGPWRTPATWTANSGYPVAADTANITGGFTVTTTAGDAARFVYVGGATLSQLTIAGNLNLSSSTDGVNFYIGSTGYTDGKVVHQSGAVINNKAMSLAYDAGTSGSYEITGGSLTLTDTSNGYLQVGRSGTGTFTQSGSSTVTMNRISDTGSGLNIGNSAGVNGTYTMTGGTLTVAGALTFIGHNGTGTMTIDGTALANLKTVILGNNTTGTGTLNLSGGTLRANSLTNGASANTQNFNFSGGTLAPYNTNATIGSVNAVNNTTITLSDTNATISSSDKDGTARTVNIYSKLTGEGAITFTGGGTNIVISAENNYTGNTTVNGGTVVWSNAVLSASADLICMNSPKIALNYDATNTIRRLYVNGEAQKPDVYKTANAPDGMEITGDGALEVTETEPPKGSVISIN